MGAVGPALDAIAAVFGFLNTEASKAYLDKSVRLQLDIQEEEAKGFDSDDAKLEALYKEAKVIFQAAKDEIALFKAQSGH